jgi:centriolar protein POC1
VLKAHAGAVRAVDFSPNGRLLLTAGDDKAVKVRVCRVLGRCTPSLYLCLCSRLFLNHFVWPHQLWALPQQRFAAALGSHGNWVRCAVFSPDGRLVASGGDDKSAKCVPACVPPG